MSTDVKEWKLIDSGAIVRVNIWWDGFDSKISTCANKLYEADAQCNAHHLIRLLSLGVFQLKRIFIDRS